MASTDMRYTLFVFEKTERTYLHSLVYIKQRETHNFGKLRLFCHTCVMDSTLIVTSNETVASSNVTKHVKYPRVYDIQYFV